MRVTTYLSFDGRCEEAFTFYAQCLDGKLGEIFRYGGSPLADQAPPDWPNKVMHGSVTVGGHVLMGADIAPERHEKARGFSLSIQLESPSEAYRIFHELANGGKIVMPLEKTFWAERFGVVVDRFGIQWNINCDGSDQPAVG